MLHVHKKYKKSKGDERACPGGAAEILRWLLERRAWRPEPEEKAGQSHRFKPKNCHRNVAQMFISKNLNHGE